MDNPSSFTYNAESVLRWLFKKWRSSKLANCKVRTRSHIVLDVSEEKIHLFQVAQHCHVYDILRILSTCIGKENFVLPNSRYFILGTIGRAYATLWDQRLLSKYIWQVEGDIIDLKLGRDPIEHKVLGQRSSSIIATLADIVVFELTASNERFDQVNEDRLQIVSIDYFKVIFKQYISCLYMLVFLDGVDSAIERNVCSAVNRLLHTLSNYLLQSDTGQEKIDEVYKILAECLPGLETYCSEIWSCSSHGSMCTLSKILLRIVESKRTPKIGEDTMLDSEMAGSRNELSISSDFSPERKCNKQSFRGDLLAFTDLSKLRSSIDTYLKFITLLPHTESSDQYGHHIVAIDQFFNHIISLSPEDLLASCRVIAEAVALGFTITQDTVDEYLSSLGTQILGNYEFERSDIGLSFCLEGLHGFLSVWSNSPQSAVFEAASDLYHWFVDTALKSGILSNKVKMVLSDLLYDIIEASPNFGQDVSLPSARDILFEVLKSGGIPTKWHVAQRIPNLFKPYTSEKHEVIFRDVCDNLPTDVDWEEGISVRLFILGRLGSARSTLLRLCVYHIFETAGSVKNSSQYATFCIAKISRSLSLPDPKDLMSLFAPQLLYTWLESQSVITIPYSIFGYKELKTFLRDVEQEVVSQLVMRAKDDEIARVAAILGTTPAQVIEESIVSSVAYTVAWDTCTAGTKLTNHGSETYLRSKFEKENYRRLIYHHLPRILGVLFISTEQEHNIEKAFQKKPIYAAAASIMDEIKANGFSAAELPAGQQPSFNARFLPDQVERVARRASMDCLKVWTETLYVYVLRMLLQKLSSSLDALHACSIIRKIRILICFAGKSATQGYALKITLHSLWPFTCKSHCAEDSYGVITYLLKQGRSSLGSEISFMAGFLFPTILSLRRFSQQENNPTRRESQSKVTRLKPQEFDSWLLQYFETFCQETINSAGQECTRKSQKQNYLVTTLNSFLSSFRHVGPLGNANARTPESDILMKLLGDAEAATPLLTETSRLLTLVLLTDCFLQPKSQKDDIFGRRTCVPEYIPTLLRLSQENVACNRDFSIWVAKTAGRLYSNQDVVLNKNGVASTYPSQSQEHVTFKAKSPRAMIVSYLYSRLFANDLEESGLAEQALRSMATNPKIDREASVLIQALDSSTLSCLNLDDSGFNNSARTSVNISLKESLKIDEDQKVDLWVKGVTVSLTRHARNDAVLGSLANILAKVATVAKFLFPYILHLVLEKELHSDRMVFKAMSDCYTRCFSDLSSFEIPFARLFIDTLFYLRSQRISEEVTIADRERWLLMDYINASRAAVRCKMYSAALLLLELHNDQEKRYTKRSSGRPSQSVPDELLLQVYKNIDEPDSFYGVHATPGLSSILNRLDYEEDGPKSLPFRGAKLDSQMRRLGLTNLHDKQSALQSLTMLNLNSLTYEILSHDVFTYSKNSRRTVLETARKLEQWELKAPEIEIADTSAIFKAFQGLSNVGGISIAQSHVDNIIGSIIDSHRFKSNAGRESRYLLKSLSVLSEVHDIVCCSSEEELKESWDSLCSNYENMRTRRYVI